MKMYFLYWKNNVSVFWGFKSQDSPFSFLRGHGGDSRIPDKLESWFLVCNFIWAYLDGIWIENNHDSIQGVKNILIASLEDTKKTVSAASATVVFRFSYRIGGQISWKTLTLLLRITLWALISGVSAVASEDDVQCPSCSDTPLERLTIVSLSWSVTSSEFK